MKGPKVTVVMPTCNRAHMLKKAIGSVLAQDFQDLELIIVDDGSEDHTDHVVRTFQCPKVVYLKQKHMGVAAARNRALREARGEYITYCDDDEYLFPDAIATIISHLEIHPEVGLAYGDVIRKPAEGVSLPRYPQRVVRIRSENFNRERFQVNYHLSAAIAGITHRKECIDVAGFFDEGPVLNGTEDYDLWLRIADYYAFIHIPRIIATSYVHSSNFILLRDEFPARIHIARKRFMRLRTSGNGRGVPYIGYYSRLFFNLLQFAKSREPSEERFSLVLKTAQEFASIDNENFEVWVVVAFLLNLRGDEEVFIEAGRKALSLLPDKVAFPKFNYLDELPILWTAHVCALLAEAIVQKGETELALGAAQKAMQAGEHLTTGPERAKLKLWYRSFEEKWKNTPTRSKWGSSSGSRNPGPS